MIYYSTSLTLYSTEIDPRRNLFIDDIGQYLNTMTYKSFDDFKRFTPTESVTVRIPVEDAVPAIGGYLDERYNYAMVEYADETGAYWYDWYYFVSSVEMIADGTLSVTLQLDALNTFRNWKGALTDRTYVKRQLIDRWRSKSDLIEPEDISGRIVKTDETKISSSPCYLVYRNSLDDGKGDPALYVTKDAGVKIHDHIRFEGTEVDSKANSGSICCKIDVTSPTDVSAYMPTLSSSVSLNVTLASGTYYIGLVGNGTNGAGSLFVCDSSGTKVKTAPTPSSRISGTWLEIDGKFEAKCFSAVSFIYIQGSTESYSFADKTSSTSYSAKLSDVDRTSSDIVKIIECPFTPELSTFGKFVYRGDKIFLRFSDIEGQLSYSFDAKMSNIIGYSKDAMPAEKAKAMEKDPKLLTGAFSYYKLVYDSYSTTVAYENVNPDCGVIIGSWTASSTMSSSCIVTLEQDAYSWLHVSEDYPFMLSSDRNNEIPLYSSEWLNYLRNGYNYDKKSNAMSIATSVLSTVGSLVMGVATIATGGASAAATIPAAVGMAGAAVSGWTSTASTINSQLAKETQMKNQSYSVSTVNDLSLFKAYGNATIKVEWWEPTPAYLDQLAALFFYRGYAVNRQYKPSLDIRTSFDYIECVPSWSGSFIQRTPPQFISLLNDRLAQGVTIIHHYDNAWDIAQEKGNIES